MIQNQPKTSAKRANARGSSKRVSQNPRSLPQNAPKIVRQQPRKLSKPVYRGPIPRVEGPKLDEFPHRGAAIDFRALLSDPYADGQAHVFEVSILGQSYALKIFKFYDDEEDDFALEPYEKEIVSLDRLHAHRDPFYNECRAYGRLKETNLDGKVAVRCHGYTTLPATIESELEERFDVVGWDRDDDDEPMKKRAVLRAIVKDLVIGDVPLTPRVAKKIKKDLRVMREQGIYPVDIKARNYKRGLLVDFSTAMTEPHYLFEIMPDFQVKMYQNEDLFAFDSMMEDEEVKTSLRAMPNQDYLRKLRSRDYLQKKYRWPRSPHVHISVDIASARDSTASFEDKMSDCADIFATRNKKLVEGSLF